MRIPALARVLFVFLAACGAAPLAHEDELAPDGADAPTTTPPPPATSWGERCGDGLDDDGDGAIDEDCAPSLFAGIYAPQVSEDPSLGVIETASARPLSVLQTYHATSALGVARTGPDLARIFARGQIPHLNIELAYPRAAYASPAAAPLAHDLAAMGEVIARALDDHAGRMFVTFGAEMNGNWTSWGCLSTATYIALYRAAHAAITAQLDARGIDRRRLRWIYGPDANGSPECPSAGAYYPGHGVVDLIGLSAYRSGTASVEQAVIAPLDALFEGTAIPAELRRDRFVLLQTGSRAVTGRDAWIRALFDTLAADPRAAGILYFNAADWAVPATGPGWSGLTGALHAAPLADARLEGTFAPHFWDVAYGDPGFAEIQALRDHGITSGCATAPPRFCPSRPLDRRAAATLLARAFELAEGAADPLVGCAPTCAADPITEPELASAITALGGTPPATTSVVATRARGAVLIARGTHRIPRPL